MAGRSAVDWGVAVAQLMKRIYTHTHAHTAGQVRWGIVGGDEWVGKGERRI